MSTLQLNPNDTIEMLYRLDKFSVVILIVSLCTGMLVK